MSDFASYAVLLFNGSQAPRIPVEPAKPPKPVKAADEKPQAKPIQAAGQKGKGGGKRPQADQNWQKDAWSTQSWDSNKRGKWGKKN